MSTPTLTLVPALVPNQTDAEAAAAADAKTWYEVDLRNDDRADIAIAEFMQLDLLAQWVATDQAFGALTESLYNEDITDRTSEMATLLEEKSTAFMRAALARTDDSEIDEFEIKIGEKIAAAAAYGVKAFREQATPNAGDLLCLMMSAAAGQGDNGRARNRKIANEMTEGFTIFCAIEPAYASWNKKPAASLTLVA